MVTKTELIEWLNSLSDDSEIGVDEGGLTLLVYGTCQNYEMGGIPTVEDIKDEAAAVRRGDSAEEFYRYPRSDWEREVGDKSTQLGYWEWVDHRIESDETK